MITSLIDTTVNDVAFVAKPRNGEAQFTAKMTQVGAADVAQLDPFQILPDALIRVEVGGVARQLLKMHTLCATLGQEVLDGLAAMNGGAVPNNEQPSSDTSQEVLQEDDDIIALKRSFLHQEQQLVIESDATDRRQVISAQGSVEHWGLSTWGVGTHNSGQ